MTGDDPRPASARQRDPAAGSDVSVSVVLPTYNRAEMLPDAIESVRDQTYGHWELIVVDDGSEDDTRDVVRRYRSDDIRYVHQENAGVAAARNRGIRESRGDWVAFIDSDDIWLPDKLERQVAVARRHPSTGMIGGGCVMIDEEGERLREPNNPPARIYLEDLQAHFVVQVSSTMIRREAFREVGGFDEELPATEDRDMWLRIARRYPVRAVPEPTVLFRAHEGPRRSGRWEAVLEGRSEVISRIRTSRGRRRGWAWQYHLRAMTASNEGRYARALWEELRSFLTFPTRLSPNVTRVYGAADALLPGPLYRAVRSVYRFFTRRG